jgi:hypothetical protein
MIQAKQKPASQFSTMHLLDSKMDLKQFKENKNLQIAENASFQFRDVKDLTRFSTVQPYVSKPNQF